MKTAELTAKTAREMKDRLFRALSVNNSVMDDIILINIRRIFYVAIMAIPVHLAHIVIFSMNASGDENEIKWRTGIIFSHTALLFLMGMLGCLCSFLRKKESADLYMRLVQNFTVVMILTFGVIVVAVDQLVTVNITPFLVACTIVGAILLVRPLFAVLAYSGAFAAFYFTIGLTQTDEAVLLSNKLNGLTAIGIGICLSIVLWTTNVSNILQKRFIADQQEELTRKNRELEYLVFHDPMTHLYNRRRFEELLRNEIAIIRRYPHDSCIIILDIDNFKRVNDNYGHPAGDMVIRQIAAVLKENVRETDVVSRWGGEEFLILLPNTSLADGRLTAEKLKKIIGNMEFSIKEKTVYITASFGVTGLRGDRKDSLEMAYKDADNALYLAKERGKNRVEIAYYIQ